MQILNNIKEIHNRICQKISGQIKINVVEMLILTILISKQTVKLIVGSLRMIPVGRWNVRNQVAKWKSVEGILLDEDDQKWTLPEPIHKIKLGLRDKTNTYNLGKKTGCRTYDQKYFTMSTKISNTMFCKP